MLALYNDGPQRRRKHRWTPTTIGASIAAHAVLIGGLVGMAKEADAKPVTEEVIAEWRLDEKPKPPPPPVVKQPEPPAPKEPLKTELAPQPEPPREHAHTPPPPVKGDFVSPKPPETPPAAIPAVNPNAVAINVADVSGIGKEGDVVGAVDPADKRAPTGNTEEAPKTEEKHDEAPAAEPASDGPMSESEVDVRPSLRNEESVQRALERNYPPTLRDAGVTGETMVQFVIDEEGRVEPGSVEVLSSSDEAFAAAARRITSTMRFTPAKSHGRNVRVTITLPVRWTIAS